MTQPTDQLFVYGTLLHLKIRQTLFEAPLTGIPAKLFQWEKYISAEGYFFIKPATHTFVTGEILLLTKEQMQIVDWWEEYPYTYQREQVEIESDDQTYRCWVYTRRHAVGKRVTDQSYADKNIEEICVQIAKEKRLFCLI